MKKIFTCISLAAATFMATTPVMAQQQKQLTDKEKAAVVKVIVPAVFDQVKQISGVDFMSLTNPNIESIINSPLFLPQVSSLRADQLNPISVTPDSLKLDLSSMDFSAIAPGMGDFIAGIVNDVKLTFSDYKEYNVSLNGQSSVLIKTGNKGTILPFNSLSVELKLGWLGTVGSMIPNFPLKDGKLISLTETANSSGTIDYTITLEDNLRSLAATLAQVPNFQISLDMTKLMTESTIKASLFGKPLQAPNAKLPMGDAVVYANLKSTTGMPADSIVLTSYDAASSKIKGYKKLTPTIGVSGANLVLTTTDSVRADVNTAWTPMSKQIVTMPATMSTAINSIMSSLVNGVVSNLKASAENGLEIQEEVAKMASRSVMLNHLGDKVSITNYTITIDSIYEAKKDEVIRVMEIDATTKVEATSLKDTKMIVDINFLKGSNKENVMNIKATAPTNDTKITVDFSPAVDPKGDGIKENVNMATLYITSDAMGIITDNETISDEVQEVTVSTTASGLYVKNGKGNYVIVNMVGKVVSTGIITSDEQYISTPNMPNGIYMISIDQSKLLRSAHKTTVKFVK